MLVIIALILEISNIALDTLHQISHMWWGEGVWVFDMFNNIQGLGAQFLIMSVFLLIATGWTITYQSLTDHANYLWVGLVGLASTTILGITTYLDNGEGHQFHDFSGWPGFFLMVT